MATIINPDNGEFIVKGTITSNAVGANSSAKIRITSTDDIDLNDIPVDFASADVALNIAGGCYTAGNHYIDGTFVANGDIISLGNVGGSLSLGANISSNLLPSANNSFSIGNASNNWAKVYMNHLILDDDELTITSGWTDGNSTSKITSGTSSTITLGNGTVGGVYVFYVDSTGAGSGSSVTITPTTANGFTTMTFTAAGDSVTATYRADGWTIMNAFRTTIA